MRINHVLVGQLEQFMEMLCFSNGENGDGVQIECNFCSQGDYMLSLEGVTGTLLKDFLVHFEDYHPAKIGWLEEPADPVTDEEIAETFGLSLPLRRSRQ